MNICNIIDRVKNCKMTLNSFSYRFSTGELKNLSPVQTKKAFKYLRPSQKINNTFSSRFDFRFDQINNSLVTQGFFQKIRSVFKWKTQYQNLSIPKSLEELEKSLPVNKNPQILSDQNKIRYTWIGHSSAVISIDGKVNLMIDPVFSERCSPFQFIGPKRYREVPCQIRELPKIDIVLVSHDHYDHLNTEALNELERLYSPLFFAGLNSKDVFPKKSKLREMDWTQTKKIIVNNQEFQITFVPACHWSRRGLFDLGKRLWGGYVIKTSKGKLIYYSGDTGYCELFNQISDSFGQFDLCILPIGVYAPRQFLKNQHTNPEEAVMIHKQLKSKKSVGVHWGTFPLSSERWDEPRRSLKEAIKKYGIKEDEFVTVNHGDSFQIDH